MRAELTQAGALNRFTDQWDKLEIVEASKPENAHLEGHNLAELARQDGKHPLDWLLDFGASENFETLFNAQILNADETQVAKLLKSPVSTIGLADAGAHLFLFCDADFGLSLLGPRVRDRGDFTLEDGLIRNGDQPTLTFGGVAAYRPELFAGSEPGRFSIVPLLRQAADDGRLEGSLYAGLWADVGTPTRLAAARAG